MVPDALRFSFALVADGTVPSGTELLIDEVRALARCGGCESEFTVGPPPLMQCPTCARVAVELLMGRELKLADAQISQSRACAALREACQESEPAMWRIVNVRRAVLAKNNGLG